jgi:electron transfer flavoprotein alpha subunit
VTVLCLVEHDAAGVADASLRALSFAHDLAPAPGPDAAGVPSAAGVLDDAGLPGAAGVSGDGGVPGAAGVAAVLFGPADQVPHDALASYGASSVHVAGPEHIPGYAPLAWARVLAGLATQTGAAAVVAAATDRGNEVMAHLGALMDLPMAANCLSARLHPGGTHELVRQRWAGLLLEDASLAATPALLTLATEAIPAVPAAEPAECTVHPLRPGLAEGDLRVRATESAGHSSGASLATARVVVGGGRGVGGPDGFAPLEELASLLGGVVGVSRVVTSEGWRPHRQQVGQTGTKITPELYLACGISGAIQHMAGCAGAKHLVAVNTDPGAPILSHADYAVLGDLREVIPALIAALRARSTSS